MHLDHLWPSISLSSVLAIGQGNDMIVIVGLSFSTDDALLAAVAIVARNVATAVGSVAIVVEVLWSHRGQECGLVRLAT
jgi:hypothetical protein